MLFGALAAVLVWVPAASDATVWLGRTRQVIACPGLGSEPAHFDFTLDMEVGSGTGILTIVGQAPVAVVTDWVVDGRWSYFSASYTDQSGGPFIFAGWIRGNWMKGYVSGHNWGTGCLTVGKLKGWL